ncbi:hypothetical protein PXK00_14850 [Phaeobacter sp. QD34_3]|uniref:hypothetical protein n=1 Tax=unclassified Phaeobacter TaxID=2621772 RepID=UPI00237FA313|nr:MULTISPECIES: hypothetical protein [unclassified Phaeobacter]MDE4134399.1 hypothetical protein [Phaeobacter sp. QD34_3]MDE4138108.1 hypothetical protein [Phaeobacter sp. QD34_24]
MKPRRKPLDYARMGALIAAIVLAKALVPDATGDAPSRQAGPLLSQPAPVYVKTIRDVLTDPLSEAAPWSDV